MPDLFLGILGIDPEDVERDLAVNRDRLDALRRDEGSGILGVAYSTTRSPILMSSVRASDWPVQPTNAAPLPRLFAYTTGLDGRAWQLGPVA